MDKSKMLDIIKRITMSGKLDGKRYNILWLNREYETYDFHVHDGDVLFSYSYNNQEYRNHKLEYIVDNFVKSLFKLIIGETDRNLF